MRLVFYFEMQSKKSTILHSSPISYRAHIKIMSNMQFIVDRILNEFYFPSTALANASKHSRAISASALSCSLPAALASWVALVNPSLIAYNRIIFVFCSKISVFHCLKTVPVTYKKKASYSLRSFTLPTELSFSDNPVPPHDWIDNV